MNVTAAQLAGICVLASAFSASVWADAGEPIRLNGELRLGYISDRTFSNDRSASAAGGHLTLNTVSWHGLSAGAALFTSQRLSGDDSEFFGSDGNGYSILGQAFVHAEHAGNSLTAGRFTVDTPFVNSDDIRMIEDNYQGVLIDSRPSKGLSLHLMHLGKWSGYDAPEPQRFTAIGEHGLNAAGVDFEGLANTALQAWYYDVPGQFRLGYAQAGYQGKWFSLASQFSDQSGGDRYSGGADGHAYGLTGTINYRNFSLTGAYNQASGSVTNAFGSGPWFTSADHHTIADANGQRAILLSLSYAARDGVTLGITRVHFHLGTDETDLTLDWEPAANLSLALVYADLQSDGQHARVLFNYRF